MDPTGRKLRSVSAAAASAVLNGCDPDEVRRAVEAGIAEAESLSHPRRAAADRVTSPPPQRDGALAAWVSAVNGYTVH